MGLYRTITATALITTTALTLSSCASASPTDTPAPQLQRISLQAGDKINVEHAGSARGLEYNATADELIMTAHNDIRTTVTSRVNTDNGETTPLRTFFIPDNENDPSQAMEDMSIEELDEVASNAADLAIEQYQNNNGASLKSGTRDHAYDMYKATFLLDQLREKAGYGFTMMHDDAGKESNVLTWQMGAGMAAVLAETDSGHDPEEKVEIVGGIPTIEKSVGICAIGPLAHDNTPGALNPVDITTIDGTDMTTTTTSLMTTSGSSSIVARHPSSLIENHVMQATLPHTLDADPRYPDQGETLTLMGLGELECTSTISDNDDAPLHHGVGIFAALDRGLADASDQHRIVSDAFDEHLLSDDDAQGEELARQRDSLTAVHPDQAGLIALIGGNGTVRTLIDSKDMVAQYPELKDKDVATIAVDPDTFDASLTTPTATTRAPLWKRLLAPLTGHKDATEPVTQQTKLWVTYDGVDTVYETTADITL